MTIGMRNSMTPIGRDARITALLHSTEEELNERVSKALDDNKTLSRLLGDLSDTPDHEQEDPERFDGMS